MQKWEYLEITLQLTETGGWRWSDEGILSDSTDVSSRLSQLGQKGWELVTAYPQSVTGHGASYTAYAYYIFKRPL